MARSGSLRAPAERQRGLRNYDSGMRNGFGPGACRRLRVSCGSRSRRPGRQQRRSFRSCSRSGIASGC